VRMQGLIAGKLQNNKGAPHVFLVSRRAPGLHIDEVFLGFVRGLLRE
jgi:hypothetical protein